MVFMSESLFFFNAYKHIIPHLLYTRPMIVISFAWVSSRRPLPLPNFTPGRAVDTWRWRMGGGGGGGATAVTTGQKSVTGWLLLGATFSFLWSWLAPFPPPLWPSQLFTPEGTDYSNTDYSIFRSWLRHFFRSPPPIPPITSCFLSLIVSEQDCCCTSGLFVLNNNKKKHDDEFVA